MIVESDEKESLVDERFFSIYEEYMQLDGSLEHHSVMFKIVSAYQEASGCTLKITKSRNKDNDKCYRQFTCVEHEDCPWHCSFGPRRSDGKCAIKMWPKEHLNENRRLPRTQNKKCWPKRYAGVMEEIYDQVTSTHTADPKPSDFVKTAQSRGIDIPYIKGWRVMNEGRTLQAKLGAQSYAMIVPFLKQFKQMNPDSTVDWSVDSENRLLSFFVCPGYSNNVLQMNRPVISIDAAHIKSAYKGVVYTYSGLTGANEMYVYAFGIMVGNECYQNWQYFNQLFLEACPIVAKILPGKTYSDYVFISDRQKGLDLSLKDTFPNNLAIHCAYHIKANVQQRYGKQAAEYVSKICKTYSRKKEALFFTQLGVVSNAAAEYLSRIDPKEWRSTAWVEETPTPNPPQPILPPRYGIVTSNTSESVNAMIATYRCKHWYHILESFLDHISNNISSNRQKYLDIDPTIMVENINEVMKIAWKQSASLHVSEIYNRTHEFKVVEKNARKLSRESQNEEELADGPETTIELNSLVSHIVDLKKKKCSCGKWQDHKYPCKHLFAVFRKWKPSMKVYKDIIDEECHFFYKVGIHQRIWEFNFYPVVSDNIGLDGTTNPPPVPKRTAGRPKELRFRKRSKCTDPQDSVITCSICKQRGHNKTTCERRRNELALQEKEKNNPENNDEQI